MPDRDKTQVPIDKFRIDLIELGLTVVQAGVIIGMTAEYAKSAYLKGVDSGWSAGLKKGRQQGQTDRNTLLGRSRHLGGRII